ncbi:Hpt domain-containing protein [Thauera aromatica]|uniref:Hpt domain-containing protein n=1 Tax=Thauera aromatica TaxID=59405 RepID=UPI001FFC5BE8|nr:Hpt domain-containing protein [Thauera aromatica]MCK2086688.1 Hpt domain-containing protein [Thauera aromatica]
MKFFRQMLMMFAESNRDTLAQLKARLAAGEHEQAARLAHQLKGVSANIAAVALSQAAHDLERAILQRTHDLDPLFDRVADELTTILG